MILNNLKIKLTEQLKTVLSSAGFGTGVNPPSGDDQALENSLGVGFPLIKTSSANRLSVVSTIDPDSLNNHDISEIGLFDQNSVLLVRCIHNPIPKNQSIRLTYKLDFEVE
ncbi:MAG: hypothetical protein QXN68_00370 [Thermoplasmata archaeon]